MAKVLVIIPLLIVSLVAFTRLRIPNLPQAYLVASGSMEPSIHVGDLLLIKPENSYQKDDVVTFYDHDHRLVTHRIIGTGSKKYKTKGDANNTPDANLVSSSQIVGKVFFRLPYWGKLVGVIKSPFGLITFVIIPVVILIVDEIRLIYSHLKSKGR